MKTKLAGAWVFGKARMPENVCDMNYKAVTIINHAVNGGFNKNLIAATMCGYGLDWCGTSYELICSAAYRFCQSNNRRDYCDMVGLVLEQLDDRYCVIAFDGSRSGIEEYAVIDTKVHADPDAVKPILSYLY